MYVCVCVCVHVCVCYQAVQIIVTPRSSRTQSSQIC